MVIMLTLHNKERLELLKLVKEMMLILLKKLVVILMAMILLST
jgi:hypothetical protein